VTVRLFWAVCVSVDVYLAIRMVVSMIGSVMYQEDKWVSNALCSDFRCSSTGLFVAHTSSPLSLHRQPYMMTLVVLLFTGISVILIIKY
jgi:hypothetical protein